MELILVSLLGYLIGSVPFALAVGKLFYGTDVRQHGSGNLGGSNTGRVLGRSAGIAVMTLDLLKSTLVVYLSARFFSHPWAVACGGLFAGVGHCYPIFAGFRGGKAVATMHGFLFGLWVCGGFSPLVCLLPLAVSLGVLYLSKIVALSSMASALATVFCVWRAGADGSLMAATAAFALLIVVRHRDNIKRILCGTENKIRWM